MANDKKVFTYYSSGKKFSNKHNMFGHKTYFTLSENLLTLYECCTTCMVGIPLDEYKPPHNIDKLICKSQRDYRTECCSCPTVMECRAKHNCCCGVILNDEIEQKRIRDKEFKASQIRSNDPELAEIICNQNKESKNA